MKKFLVTGCAGFIGFHLCHRLLRDGHEVLGLDNLSPFYDEGLKQARLAILREHPGLSFVEGDIADRSCVEGLFTSQDFGPVVHLAAQAGIRYSLKNPHLYVQSNLVGFTNLIEAASKRQTPHFVFSSSSSVYGANLKVPFLESDNVDHPISLYAATKKSNELIAHVYAHLYRLPVSGLRFFTVYGPWGRPDMALFKFCKAIFQNEPIDLYNNGHMLRDFTYVDDIVEGVVRVVENPPTAASACCKNADNASPFRILNIGNHQPVELTKLIEVLEEKIGRKAITRSLPMQPGDVPATYADTEALAKEVGYRPNTPIEEGVGRFVDWYRQYYKV